MSINSVLPVSYNSGIFRKEKSPVARPNFTGNGNNPGQDMFCSTEPRREINSTFRSLCEKLIEHIDKKTEEARQKRELEQLRKNCTKMIENFRETQKEFQDIYLRRDITPGRTLKMIQEFNELETIRITGDRDTYTQKLFQTVKRNFGFEDFPFELKTTDKPIMGNDKILGFATPLGDIIIRDDIPAKDLIKTLHHEFRHVKQRYCAFNASPDEYVKANQPKNIELPLEIFCIAFGNPQEHNLNDFDKNFVKNSVFSVLNYTPVSENVPEYFKQWAEEDARNTENKIANLLR